MEIFVFFFIAAVFLIAGCSNKKSNDVTVLGWGTQYSDFPETLKGKVKEVVQNTYWAVDSAGKTVNGALLTQKEYQDSGLMSGFHAFYNDSGVPLRHEYFGDNSQVNWSHVNEIANGRVVKEKWVSHDTVGGYALFNYNDKGFVDNIPMLFADTIYGKLILTNDDKGHTIGMKVYNSKDVFTNRVSYTLNPEGKTIEVDHYLPNDLLVSKLLLSYNDHGGFDNVKICSKTGNIKTEASGIYTYDDKGNWIRSVWTVNGKPMYIDERSYVYY